MSRLVLSFAVEGNPGDGAVNRSRGVARGRIYKSRQSKCFASRATQAALLSWSKSSQPVIAECRVVIRSYWTRLRRLDGVVGLPMGDVDAPVKAILDALESGRILDDDTRVRCVEASKHYDKDSPRIEVEVWTH